MKTVTQYKEEISALLKKAGDIEAQAQAETRDMTEAELALHGQLLEAIQENRKQIKAVEDRERIEAELKTKPQALTVPKGTKVEMGEDRAALEKFPTLGAQLAAVISAGRSGGRVDPRLFNAAATGLSESVQSDGGFLVQQDFANLLLQDVINTGILASRCRQQPISGGSNSIRINGVDETSRASTRFGGILGYWADEAAEKTASKPKFRKIELNLHKLIGLCYATDELLQDAAALEAFIRSAFPSEFNFQVDDAIINGDGVGKPLGVLNAGCLVSVSKETGQKAATIVAENIVKMYSRMFAPSLGSAVWLINQDTLPQLYTLSLSVGTGGAPIFMPAGGLSQSPYNTILGRPVIPIEQCATLGTVGDIIFADLGGYILATKGGIQADMSIHVKFVYDESVFRFVMRLDGQPLRESALTPYKGTNTLSHFVALATRS